MSELIESVEIAPNTYWVGKRDPKSIFHANPYLRIFRGVSPEGRAQQFNLLIDPGSRSDFAVVSTKVSSLIGSLSRVSAVWVNHQDPDVSSSASMIVAKHSPRAAVICSEATWRLIVHYGLPRERFFSTERFKSGLRLPTGDRLLPVPSPFCHFRGAVMLYDPATRVLFSGDLFGGLTVQGAEGIWADESDWRGMRAFHQMYMPTQKALAIACEAIRALEPKVEIIAPQHGRVIPKELIGYFLERLERLPVGLDVLDANEEDPQVLVAWNSVLARVLETARMYLGPHAEDRLASCDDLEDVLRFGNDGKPRLDGLGRWAVGGAVNAITENEPPAVANAIKQEALIAADELELPPPDLHLEEYDEGEGTPGL